MKKSIYIVIILLSTRFALGQQLKKIIISADTMQEMTWPIEISLKDATASDKISYQSTYAGKNIYTINIAKKKLSMTSSVGLLEFELTKFEALPFSGYYAEGYDKKKNSNVKLLLSQKVENTDYVLIIMYPTEENQKENTGYFAVNTKVEMNK